MLVAVFVALVVMGASSTFFAYQVHAMRTERDRRAAQMAARFALHFMVRQLEQVGRDPERVLFSSLDDTTLPPAIASADATHIHYRTNLSIDDDDVDTLDAWEDVTFAHGAGAIWVTQGAGVPLALTDAGGRASHVADGGLELRYFDGFGDPIPDLAGDDARASVRRIRVRLTVTGGSAEGADGAPVVTLSQDVFLRNAS
jgi:hypothetical protein